MDMMLNGKPADISDFEADELAAAVLISLFSWRKSNPDDGVRAPNRQGWWGGYVRAYRRGPDRLPVVAAAAAEDPFDDAPARGSLCEGVSAMAHR